MPSDDMKPTVPGHPPIPDSVWSALWDMGGVPQPEHADLMTTSAKRCVEAAAPILWREWTANRRLLPALSSKTLDLVHRCRLAQQENDGHPFGSWSTGEQLFVALVLRDKVTLDAMDYTPTEVAQRLIGDGWVPADPDDPSVFLRWLEAVRVEVAFPGFITGTEARVNS